MSAQTRRIVGAHTYTAVYTRTWLPGLVTCFSVFSLLSSVVSQTRTEEKRQNPIPMRDQQTDRQTDSCTHRPSIPLLSGNGMHVYVYHRSQTAIPTVKPTRGLVPVFGESERMVSWVETRIVRHDPASSTAQYVPCRTYLSRSVAGAYVCVTHSSPTDTRNKKRPPPEKRNRKPPYPKQTDPTVLYCMYVRTLGDPEAAGLA